VWFGRRRPGVVLALAERAVAGGGWLSVDRAHRRPAEGQFRRRCWEHRVGDRKQRQLIRPLSALPGAFVEVLANAPPFFHASLWRAPVYAFAFGSGPYIVNTVTPEQPVLAQSARGSRAVRIRAT
jgi:hypothetical protein